MNCDLNESSALEKALKHDTSPLSFPRGWSALIQAMLNKAKHFLKVPLPKFDIAAPAEVVRPFLESPPELRMSSAPRLLIFHASIGTEHVQTCAHFPPAATCLVTFDFLHDKNHIELRAATGRVDAGWKSLHRVPVCTLQNLWESAPL